ncbi:MAG TPA: glycosyltransferase family 2 protein [Thermoanaerobaculia bacterium]|nr:glycosyltransferase family 2 protein [Thermoanaerobaculia bacterium]
MRFSVVIPCRNAVRTVADAVRSARDQIEPPLEVIVVDDASEDASAEAAENAGARVIRNSRRRNAGGARNAGMEAARGDAFAFLDADAIAPRDWLGRVEGVFESDPEVVGVGGRIANGRPGRWGELDWYLNHSEWIRRGVPGPRKNIPTMGIVYLRDAIGNVRFPETNFGEDTAFALGVAARGGKLWYEPEIVLTHLHERLDATAFRQKQIACGRTIYLTRSTLDRPGRVLVKWPGLLFSFPHLWVTIARMARAGHAGKAVRLFPWLVAGEVYRIRGFFEARKERAAEVHPSRREESPEVIEGGASRRGSASVARDQASGRAGLASRSPVAPPGTERASATERV